MSSTTAPWSPKARARGPIGAVVLVHLIVIGFWWQATGRTLAPPPRAGQAPLLLRWLPAPSPPPAVVPQPAPERRADRQPRPVRAQPPQAITALPWAATPPAATPAATPAVVAPPPPATAASAPPRPLDLRLPTGPHAEWRRRPPALDDPRANTTALTLEGKLAQAMGGSGAWREERVDPDRVVFRRGAECIVATRSRAGQLELAGGAFRELWAVKAC